MRISLIDLESSSSDVLTPDQRGAQAGPNRPLAIEASPGPIVTTGTAAETAQTRSGQDNGTIGNDLDQTVLPGRGAAQNADTKAPDFAVAQYLDDKAIFSREPLTDEAIEMIHRLVEIEGDGSGSARYYHGVFSDRDTPQLLTTPARGEAGTPGRSAGFSNARNPPNASTSIRQRAAAGTPGYSRPRPRAGRAAAEFFGPVEDHTHRTRNAGSRNRPNTRQNQPNIARQPRTNTNQQGPQKRDVCTLNGNNMSNAQITINNHFCCKCTSVAAPNHVESSNIN